MKIETKTQIMAPGHHLPFEVVSLVLQGGGACLIVLSMSMRLADGHVSLVWPRQP
jgi:hypothetical protein